MNVAENLYDYLKHNDKAELIGFGTFYIKGHSARINSLTSTIEPPSREILFTKEQTNDMSFVSFMAQHEFISQETALTWIKQYSDSLKEKLDAGRNYKIGKLGTLNKGSLGEYTFVPDENLNLMDDAFALGELKNVKTFDVNPQENKVDLIHTKPEKEVVFENKVDVETKIEEGKQMAIEEEKQKDIKQRIEELQKLREEEKVQESEPETTTRIIRHSEADIKTDVEKPLSETDIKDKLKMDSTPEDKIEQTLKKTQENKENIVVEDIKKIDKKEEENEKEQDELRKKAQEIINKNKKQQGLLTEEKPKKKRHHNGRKKGWLIVFWIIICLIALCGGFVAAHYFGLLKDVGFLKPVTEKLSYYIPVRQTSKTKVIKPKTTTITPTETVAEEVAPSQGTEVPQTPYQAQEVTTPAPAPKKKAVNNINRNNKNNKNKKNAKQTAPAPKPQPVVDNSPVTTQNYSRLGFDVIGGNFSDKSKAENLARKAKSFGYDSYVLSKIKSGSPIYYVSYGSRRTLTEANNLMQSMMNKMGGSYYVISR